MVHIGRPQYRFWAITASMVAAIFMLTENPKKKKKNPALEPVQELAHIEKPELVEEVTTAQEKSETKH